MACLLLRVARNFLVNRRGLKLLRVVNESHRPLCRNFNSFNALQISQIINNMPPKRKREADSSEPKPTKSTSKKSTANEKPEPKPRRKAVIRKEEPSSSSESEAELPPKRAKKANKVVKNDEDEVVPKSGRSRKNPPAAKNKTETAYKDIDFNGCTRKTPDGNDWNFKVASWNVDGIRAWLKKGGLDYVTYEQPDVFCLQETKCSMDKLPQEVQNVDGYKVFWHLSEKDGYAGVALYSKEEPISVNYGLGNSEHDSEGRMITAEFEKFYVIGVYVPNAGRGLVTLPKRLNWNDVFRDYVSKLDEKKPVILCGDMNVAHLEIDLANPKTNAKNAGFTPEERNGLTEFLGDGYVDTFRKLYPDKTQCYTFWTYMGNCRAKNVGWRLDYLIVSERLMDSVCDNVIRNEVFGSDHCPVVLFLNL